LQKSFRSERFLLRCSGDKRPAKPAITSQFFQSGGEDGVA
jgi:hypothetical protein